MATWSHPNANCSRAHSKFNEVKNRYSIELRALLALMLYRKRQTQGAYLIVLQDSTAIAVCHIARARLHHPVRTWAFEEWYGLWYDFKLHMQCDVRGPPLRL